MRQIVLDTETTGLETSQDHRIIEIGCVELVNRKLTGKHYHQYINPERNVDEGAMQVHGITDEFLQDKPLFANIVDDFLAFVGDSELVIHNAPFDVGFIDHELSKLPKQPKSIANLCHIVDTLALARNKHPGQRNNLDALCKRYMVDNSQRDLHGALLDAEILADVYLVMTGGQVNLNISDQSSVDEGAVSASSGIKRLPADRSPLKVIKASDAELASHNNKLETIKSASGHCVWQDISQ
ncbi:MAG: DNA polymerase III subunit epsilon [Porticoccaceae bacterium]